MYRVERTTDGLQAALKAETVDEKYTQTLKAEVSYRVLPFHSSSILDSRYAQNAVVRARMPPLYGRSSLAYGERRRHVAGGPVGFVAASSVPQSALLTIHCHSRLAGLSERKLTSHCNLIF